MALLVIQGNYFICAFKRTLCIYNFIDGTNEKHDLPILSNEASNNSKENPESSGDEIDEKSKCNVNLDSSIQNMKFSYDKKLLAVTTKCKEIFVYDWSMENGKLNLKQSSQTQRASSAIEFSPDSENLIISDKSGDCYSLSMKENSKNLKWLLGHLSMVLDILFSPDGRFIITCDRDEKVRITRFPETFIIESYCLGHTEYISSIELLPHNKELLLSISGDSKMILWNYIEGKQITSIDLPLPGYKIQTFGIDNNSSIAVIILYDLEQILLYKITDLNFELIKSHTFTNQIVSSIAFQSSENLFVLLVDGSSGLVNCFQLSNSDGYTEKHLHKNLTNLYKDEILKDKKSVMPLDLSLMFKKKFDNVKEYHERKKKRIEGKLNLN